MGRPVVVLDLAAGHARDLAAGGVFVLGCTLGVLEDCELVVRTEAEELRLSARVVFVDERGAGLELVDCPAETLAKLGTLAEAADSAVEVDDEREARRIALNIHERLRGLTLVQQIKIAQHGELSERIVLERIYGKTVWEPLLRNPRITPPEVARIARMGALPKPMLEQIVSTSAWLQIPEIRRALLSHPRLATDQILRVLRHLPKHELRLACTQPAYPHAVREAAKRHLRELDS